MYRSVYINTIIYPMNVFYLIRSIMLIQTYQILSILVSAVRIQETFIRCTSHIHPQNRLVPSNLNHFRLKLKNNKILQSLSAKTRALELRLSFIFLRRISSQMDCSDDSF